MDNEWNRIYILNPILFADIITDICKKKIVKNVLQYVELLLLITPGEIKI